MHVTRLSSTSDTRNATNVATAANMLDTLHRSQLVSHGWDWSTVALERLHVPQRFTLCTAFTTSRPFLAQNFAASFRKSSFSVIFLEFFHADKLTFFSCFRYLRRDVCYALEHGWEPT